MRAYRAVLVWVFLLGVALAFTLLTRPGPPPLAQRLAQGGEVRLGAGTFRVERPLELGPGLRLVGAGPDRTRLVLAPGAFLALPLGVGRGVRLEEVALEREGNAEAAEEPPVLQVPATSRLEARALVLKGEGRGTSLLWVRGEASLKGCRLEGGPRGVRVALVLAEESRVALEECLVRNAIQAGVVVPGKAHLDLRGGQVGPTGHNGVLVYPGGSLRAEGVLFTGNPFAAVAVMGEAEVYLRGNRAEEGRYALAVAPGAKPLMEDNQWKTRAVVARVGEEP